MQAVDGVVLLFDVAHQLGIRGLEHHESLPQHVGDAVAHMQRLAHGAGQRLRRRVEDVGIEMARLAEIGGFRPVRHHALGEGRDEIDERQKNRRDREIERGVEIDRDAAGIGFNMTRAIRRAARPRTGAGSQCSRA